MLKNKKLWLGLGVVLTVMAGGWFLLAITFATPSEAKPPVTAVALLSPRTPFPVDNAETATVKQGEQLFQTWCNSCHPSGQAGYGNLDLWGGKANPPAQLIRDRIRHRDLREQKRFAALSEAHLDSIIAYIVYQQQTGNSK
jgi:mono/diheme cytochrome c family protein